MLSYETSVYQIACKPLQFVEELQKRNDPYHLYRHHSSLISAVRLKKESPQCTFIIGDEIKTR